MFERIIGVCISNSDPEKRGRIRFRADAVLEGADYPHWAESVQPPGFFLKPEPGDLVEILLPRLEDVVESPEFVFWTGRLFSNRSSVPEEFRSDPPRKTGYKTPAGHVLLFDDSEGAESILVLHKSGSRLEMRQNGEIVAYDGDGGEDALVTKTEFNDWISNTFDLHKHGGVTTGAGVTFVPDLISSSVTGTSILKGK